MFFSLDRKEPKDQVQTIATAQAPGHRVWTGLPTLPNVDLTTFEI